VTKDLFQHKVIDLSSNIDFKRTPFMYGNSLNILTHVQTSKLFGYNYLSTTILTHTNTYYALCEIKTTD